MLVAVEVANSQCAQRHPNEFGNGMAIAAATAANCSR
jgi:hypothetical protein